MIPRAGRWGKAHGVECDGKGTALELTLRLAGVINHGLVILYLEDTLDSCAS